MTKMLTAALLLLMLTAAPIQAQPTDYQTCTPAAALDFVAQDALWLRTYIHISEIIPAFADRIPSLAAVTPPPPLLLKYLFGRIELALAVGLPALAADNHCIEIATLLDHTAAVLSHLLTWQPDQPLAHRRQWDRNLERRLEPLNEATDRFIYMLEYANRDR